MKQSIGKMIQDICFKYGITEKDLKSKSRFAVLVMARKELAKKLREMGLSYNSIGFFVGGRDHTTIAHYLDKK